MYVNELNKKIEIAFRDLNAIVNSLNIKHKA